MTCKKLTLVVDKESIGRFTTLLQSGVKLNIPSNISLGLMLASLPGFDMDYIINRIETIFLDGNAIDDLETPLIKDNHVLALSAAMPGLAGAIFRKNSFVAALRTKNVDTGNEKSEQSQLSITVKMFNMIAREKGPLLFQQGCIFPADKLIDFFTSRSSAIEQIIECSLDTETIEASSLLLNIDSEKSYTVSIYPR